MRHLLHSGGRGCGGEFAQERQQGGRCSCGRQAGGQGGTNTCPLLAVMRGVSDELVYVQADAGEVLCSDCKTSNKPGYKFCRSCGKPSASSPRQSASPP